MTEAVTEFGIWSLAPTLIVLITAIITRNSLQALLLGCIIGCLMVAQTGALEMLTEVSLKVIQDEDVGWIILVCGLMGSLIGLMIHTGAIGAFAQLMTGYMKSKTSALTATWGLGLMLFVDDYLNSLAAGSAMRKITDTYQSSREMLAYVIDSTAAPISVLIPISTWAVFFSALIVDNNLAAEGEGLATYIGAIPYMLYAWAAVLLVPLVIWKKVPLLGPMKTAELRAEQQGLCVPPDAEHIEEANQAITEKPGVQLHAGFFMGVIATLVAATWYLDLDFLQGLYVTLGLTGIYLVVARILSIEEVSTTFIDGFKTMLEPLAVLFLAFMFKEVNDSLNLTPYVIESIQPYLTAELLPVMIFLVMGFVSFATGSNWGVFVIILPIVTALGNALQADMTLLIGATLSASTFGSHACFYSDATVLTAQASGCTPFQHAITQLPYALIAAAVSSVGYLAIAFF